MLEFEGSAVPKGFIFSRMRTRIEPTLRNSVTASPFVTLSVHLAAAGCARF